ncbi:hypothetical protein NBRC10513v2_001036 [Rhodotorula toruloides]|uniref:BY PROTMAP: gi/472586105/gb/EMS23647.1/ indoleamine 2,3-dioxygenase [Rhodosporidium toruloides NP11] gi/647395490/emb/CDR36942.1/ RHTO0S02e08856g1_1 [Rhodosporidium toruloides] n=1 Tax=Rhodotorula toruloides TaxID=5286 RepID=A0A0K3CFJ4_RHOTO|nr:hypothetical protein AAT19DRAFT_15923 [Rhodotorula toruloides]
MVATSPRPAARRVPFPIFEDESKPLDLSTLPSDHFLAQRPVTPPRPESVIDEANWADRARPDTSSLAAADYDVSVATGFLPPEEPVQTLRGIGHGWDEVEDALERAQEEAASMPGGGVGKLSEAWRESVRRLPRASVDVLATLPMIRRAHTLLAHVEHFYMHSTFPSQTVVPASIAIPLVQVSDRLGLPPILTYADTVLWTWKMTDKSLGLRADNLEITTTFTSTPSERAFFLLSLFCELHGPSILRLMSSTLDESFFADSIALARIATYLNSISALIDELTALMAGATRGPFGPEGRERISPEAFYWEIRPWFNGGKWTFEGVGKNGEDKVMEWGGPSAGQSSLVHALDVFLGVDHAPRHGHGRAVGDKANGGDESQGFPNTCVEPPSPTAASSSKPAPPAIVVDKAALHKAPSDATFMQRMSHYMPGHHRAFLRHLESLHHPNPSAPNAPVLPSLRKFAKRHPAELGPAYDGAVAAMKRFRDQHMRLATVFIVQQVRREPARESVHWAEWEAKRVKKEAEKEERRRLGEVEGAKKREAIAGTGGTDLVTFLKRCRERTVEALLQQE